MLEFKNPVISIIVNFFLLLWQLPQTIVGLLALAIFRNYEVYHNEDAKIKVLQINKWYVLGYACCSLGPFILTTPSCEDNTKKHESGHSKQSLYLGPIYLLAVALPSVCLYCYKFIFKKDITWYLSKYPECWAEKLGHTKR